MLLNRQYRVYEPCGVRATICTGLYGALKLVAPLTPAGVEWRDNSFAASVTFASGHRLEMTTGAGGTVRPAVHDAVRTFLLAAGAELAGCAAVPLTIGGWNRAEVVGPCTPENIDKAAAVLAGELGRWDNSLRPGECRPDRHAPC